MPCVVDFAEVNLGERQPQLLCFPALSPVPKTTLISPHWHTHRQTADPSFLLGSLFKTVSAPKTLPVISLSVIY